MTLEIRPTDDDARFDLYDGDERMGEIRNVPLDEEGVALGEPPDWVATLWSQMGTGKTWSAEGESFDEAKRHAHELHEEFVAERRELSKGSRIWTVGSIPMGGQKRRR